MTDIAIRQIDSNGIQLRIAEAGTGPLVLSLNPGFEPFLRAKMLASIEFPDHRTRPLSRVLTIFNHYFASN